MARRYREAMARRYRDPDSLGGAGDMICETCLVEVASFRGAWQCNICGAAGTIPFDPLRTRRVAIGRRLRSAMGKFERECRLLTEEARQQLESIDAKRTNTISEALELATKTICEFPKESLLSDQPQTEIVDFSQLLFFRQKLVEMIANEARDGVREFSNAVLRSQGRVGSEAGLLRKYTALVIRDLREWLNSSILFRDEPLGDWQNDTIAQETIHCCESIVAERGLLGDHWPYGTEQLIERDSGNWLAGIMEWEAHKDPDNVHPNRDERL